MKNKKTIAGAYNYAALRPSDRVRIPEGNLETLQEVDNKELYKDFIKDHCVGCFHPLPSNWEWYRHHGNWCQRCCNRATARATGKKFKTGREFGLKD